MSQLTPDDLKPHLALSLDDHGDDVLVQGYIDAAEAHVAKHLRRDLEAEFPAGWPAPILQAVRMMVAHFYAHREATAERPPGEVPLGAKALLAPWRDLGA